jgi:hypothetical protein
MKVSGCCFCGQISFEAEIEPDKVRVCHCTDCQTLPGSAFRTNVPVVQRTFVLKKGEPKTFLKSADNGNQIVHAFCPDCGTPIYSAVPGSRPATRCASAPSIGAPNLFPRDRSGGARRCPRRYVPGLRPAARPLVR